MAASVVCTYIFFLSVIYLIYKEFSWFLSKRHDFLSRSTPDNYTVCPCPGNQPSLCFRLELFV